MDDAIAGRIDTRYAADVVEARLALDLRQLRSLGVLERGRILTWLDEAGRPHARIVTTPAPGSVRASFALGKENLTALIPVITTPCPFGGCRPWFVCLGCGQRRLCLYFADARFCCRGCLALTYASERAGRLQRKWLRADHRTAELVGAGAAHGKPLRMSWARYLELRVAAERAEQAAQAEYRAVALKLRAEAIRLGQRA